MNLTLKLLHVKKRIIMTKFKKYIEDIINGIPPTEERILKLLEEENLDILIAAANRIRKIFVKDRLHLCCAISIKTGGCMQNCSYCSQSGYYKTHVGNIGYEPEENIVKFSHINNNKNIGSIGLNSATGYYSELQKHNINAIVERIIKETNLKICAAYGILKNEDEAKEIKETGIYRYEHNLQTSENFFNNICTTHSYIEKINTIKYAKKAGLKICSGGIIGLGETFKDRIQMAFLLKKLNVKSIPINILNPVKGTPLAFGPIKLTKEEALKTFAIFRIILPDANIIFGAGRDFLKDMLPLAFKAGLNGIVVGNMLTNKGNEIEKDIEILRSSIT